MTAQDCLEELRRIRDAAFATVDETGAPQVRIIDVMLAEAGALYFCTARGKEFYRQLAADGRVAVTALNRDWQMFRLSGRARRLEDQKTWIDRIFAANPSMEQVYPGPSRYVLEPFCVDNGEVEYFDLGRHPIARQRFALGEAAAAPKGFAITAGCIGCGKCSWACPQQCIRPGRPYAIDQAHCLHCGLCYETCPVQAVERKGGDR